jgi:hypothetical protein
MWRSTLSLRGSSCVGHFPTSKNVVRWVRLFAQRTSKRIAIIWRAFHNNTLGLQREIGGTGMRATFWALARLQSCGQHIFAMQPNGLALPLGRVLRVLPSGRSNVIELGYRFDLRSIDDLRLRSNGVHAQPSQLAKWFTEEIGQREKATRAVRGIVGALTSATNSQMRHNCFIQSQGDPHALQMAEVVDVTLQEKAWVELVALAAKAPNSRLRLLSTKEVLRGFTKHYEPVHSLGQAMIHDC